MFALLLTLPTIALAQPSQEILNKIEKSYDPKISVSESFSDDSRDCSLTDLRIKAKDPVLNDEAVIEVKVYTPKIKNEGDRTVILLPPTGGENMLDRSYANTLCSSGFRTALLQTWSHQLDTEIDLTMHDKGALRALASVRHLIDYLNPSHANQIGLLGTSIGAITGALVMGFDKRINVAALIVGGVHMPEIIAFSTESGATQLREARRKKFGYANNEEYLAALKKHVLIEPLDFATFSGPKKVLAFIGTKDLTVPSAYQVDLARAFNAQTLEYDGSHIATIIRTNMLEKSRIIDFFTKNLR